MDAVEPRITGADVQPTRMSDIGSTDVHLAQSSLRQILAIWAAATIPVGVLAWIAAPLLANAYGGENALPKALMIALTAGLVSQFVLVLILIYREQRSPRLVDSTHRPMAPRP